MSPERVDANWQSGRHREPAFTQKIEQLVSAYIMAVFRELELKFTEQRQETTQRLQRWAAIQPKADPAPSKTMNFMDQLR